MSTLGRGIRFGVIGIDHRHIYDLIQGLLDVGATCAGLLLQLYQYHLRHLLQLLFGLLS